MYTHTHTHTHTHHVMYYAVVPCMCHVVSYSMPRQGQYCILQRLGCLVV